MNYLKALLRINLLVLALCGIMGVATTATSFAATMPAPTIVAGAPAASPTDGIKQDACKGLRQVDDQQGCGTGSRSLYKVIATVVEILSYIVGVAAVIMIIVSGLKYITSNGDSNAISSAKTTLVYAIIGLVVVALAQFLVTFVLKQTDKAVSPPAVTRSNSVVREM